MAKMTFYKFKADDTSSDNEFGFAIANDKDFNTEAETDFIYLDPQTSQWTSYSNTTDPSYDLKDEMQALADFYGADGYELMEDDDEVITSSINRSQVSRISKMNDELKYGIDIDLNSMTVTGTRKDVEAWKAEKNQKVAMKSRTASYAKPEWVDIESDFAVLDNHKGDTAIQRGFDGKLHLFYNNIDYGVFDSVQSAKDFYDNLHMTSLTSNSFKDEYENWLDSLEDVDDEYEQSEDIEDPVSDIENSETKISSRIAGIWKLNLDAPITAQDKKTFLDNSVDVDQSETNDGTVILTMTGNDKVVADTAEFLGLTDDFAADAYTSSDTPEAVDKEAPIDKANDDLKSDADSNPSKSENDEKDDPQEKKIKNDISSILDSFKKDVADRSASMKTSSNFSLIFLNGSKFSPKTLEEFKEFLSDRSVAIKNAEAYDGSKTFSIIKEDGKPFWTGMIDGYLATRKLSSPIAAFNAMLKEQDSNFVEDIDDSSQSYEQGELFASRRHADTGEVVQNKDNNQWDVIVKKTDDNPTDGVNSLADDPTNSVDDTSDNTQIKTFNSESEANQYIDSNNLENVDDPAYKMSHPNQASVKQSHELDKFTVIDADGCPIGVNVEMNESDLGTLYSLSTDLTAQSDPLSLCMTNAMVFRNDDGKYAWTVEGQDGPLYAGVSDTFEEAEDQVYQNLKEWLTNLAAESSCQDINAVDDSDTVLSEDYDIDYSNDDDSAMILI